MNVSKLKTFPRRILDISGSRECDGQTSRKHEAKETLISSNSPERRRCWWWRLQTESSLCFSVRKDKLDTSINSAIIDVFLFILFHLCLINTRKHVVGSFYSYKVLYLEKLLQSLTNRKIKLAPETLCKELLLIRLVWSAVCLPAPATSPRSWWWGRWRTQSCPSARRCSEAVCPSCRFYRRVEGCRLSSRSPEHDDRKRTTRARLDDLTGVCWFRLRLSVTK